MMGDVPQRVISVSVDCNKCKISDSDFTVLLWGDVTTCNDLFSLLRNTSRTVCLTCVSWEEPSPSCAKPLKLTSTSVRTVESTLNLGGMTPSAVSVSEQKDEKILNGRRKVVKVIIETRELIAR